MIVFLSLAFIFAWNILFANKAIQYVVGVRKLSEIRQLGQFETNLNELHFPQSPLCHQLNEVK